MHIVDRNPITSGGREPAVDGAHGLAEDVTCRGCGYNLRGLARDAVCPECSRPVEHSIREELRFSDPAWLHRVGLGMLIALAGFLLPLLLKLNFMVPAIGLAILAGSIVAPLVGTWLATSPEPGRTGEGALSARRVARWCVVALAVLRVAALGLMFSMPALLLSLGGLSLWLAVLVSVAILIVAIVAGLVYLRRLAERMDARVIRAQLRIVAWGLGTCLLPVMAGPMLLLSSRVAGISLMVMFGSWIGLFVFSIWALVLLGVLGCAILRTARSVGPRTVPRAVARGAVPAQSPRPPRRGKVSLDGDGCLAEDVPCAGCGGNLRGLTRDETCLECATPVGQSIAA